MSVRAQHVQQNSLPRLLRRLATATFLPKVSRRGDKPVECSGMLRPMYGCLHSAHARAAAICYKTQFQMQVAGRRCLADRMAASSSDHILLCITQLHVRRRSLCLCVPPASIQFWPLLPLVGLVPCPRSKATINSTLTHAEDEIQFAIQVVPACIGRSYNLHNLKGSLLGCKARIKQSFEHMLDSEKAGRNFFDMKDMAERHRRAHLSPHHRHNNLFQTSLGQPF